MKKVNLTPEIEAQVVGAMGSTIFFSSLGKDQAKWVVQNSIFLSYDTEEVLVNQGDISDCFYMLLNGKTRILVKQDETDEFVEVGKITPPRTIGEIGILLDQPRTATVVCDEPCLLLRFDKETFTKLFLKVQGFGQAVCVALARRLDEVSRKIPVISHEDEGMPDPEVVSMLPLEFIQRHRVLPLKLKGKLLTVGLVDDMTPALMNMLRRMLPSINVDPVGINVSLFNQMMRGYGSGGRAPKAEPPGRKAKAASAPMPAGKIDLDILLQRMVAEGASDIHISAGQCPRWRVDGEMIKLKQLAVPDDDEVLELLKGFTQKRFLEEFRQENDVDYGFSVPDLARFRVNLFRDHNGSGFVFRVIPSKIMTLEQLGMPAVLKKICEQKKGLVLVTGPTGSGKSTTLAAMVDHINKTFKQHIITLEDPIEFVHHSDSCMINQREVGSHTASFHRALKAALREDPDIVLVGEMRDLETMALALETANTGHLVFGTLHTATAISTIDRIIDLFPAEKQSQIRVSLAESLLAVVAQTLCKRSGGGRVAAVEVLVANPAVANLIREGKTNQLLSIMQTGKQQGNTLLNDELFRLVQERKVDAKEAIDKAADKVDLERRLASSR